MLVLEICKEMGWDYYTYLKQPQSFITMIISRMVAKSKVEKFNHLKNK